MNVFISWSGNESKVYAEAIHQWLPNVIQAIKPFYSPVDIKAGMRWSNEIAEKLQETNIGILCLTKDNLNAPWLMFEAGALSKQFESRVCSILFGLRPADVQGPLTQFQINEFNAEGFYNVLVSINEQLPAPLTPEALRDAFQEWWSELDTNIENAIPKEGSPSIKSTRTERDLIEEILIRIRNSTVEYPINTDMIEMLIHYYGCLTDTARYIKDDKKKDTAAHALWHLQFPIQHFITRISETDKRQKLARAYADAVSIFFQGNGDVDKEKLIRNLMQPSPGLITTAPVIPNTDNTK